MRDLVRSRGLGDVYKRQVVTPVPANGSATVTGTNVGATDTEDFGNPNVWEAFSIDTCSTCLLYTSDAADERSSVDLGGRRIIKKKKKIDNSGWCRIKKQKI